MTGKRKIAVTFVALLALGAFVAPALAGGTPGGAAPGVLTLPDGSTLVIRIGNPVVRARGNRLALAVRATALLHGRMRIAGRALRRDKRVWIERRDPLAGWIAVASAAVAADGGFVALWRPDRVGPLALRAVAVAPPAGAVTADPAADPSAPQVSLTVYKAGIASWYGPTAKNETTACGIPLTRWTLGVAHRTLPCGTPVALYYKGHTVVVPVIDRGPYMTGRTWDLTRATHDALGATDGLISVGALPLTPTPAPAPSPSPAPAAPSGGAGG
ncbi:MAG TPA: septal ring lytic transglycosylase RlpA family protein [Conexibacter sp.]|nr:septal ring lytic transglycosylase RlpA family protein [Conexibacter sp.]